MQLTAQIVKVVEKAVGKGPKQKIVFEHTYSDGSVVISRVIDTALLYMGSVDFIGAPTYCHPCRNLRTHLYYKHNQEAHCLSCFNKLGENDTRPFAEVIPFPTRSKAYAK